MAVEEKRRKAQVIETFDNDRFLVRGEATEYEDPVDAMRRARQLGKGSVVYRKSDGKVLSTIPDYVPPAPKGA